MTHQLVRTSKSKSASLLSSANKNKSAELEKEELKGQDSDNGKSGSGEQLSGEQSLEEGDMTRELGEDEGESRGSADEPVLTPGATVVCTEGMATRIHRVIVKSILPLLHKCLTHKVGAGRVSGRGDGAGWDERGWGERDSVGWDEGDDVG